MAERDTRAEKQDLTLLPNEFAWVLDETSGGIRTHSGPNSSSVSQSETVVVFDEKSKRFASATALGRQGKQLKIIAPEGWYAVVKNPSEDFPRDKDKQATPDKIRIGQKLRERMRLDEALRLSQASQQQKLDVARLDADGKHTSLMMQSFSPALIAALQGIGDRETLVKIAEAFGSQGLMQTLGGSSLVDVLQRALKGTPMSERLSTALARIPQNGVVADAE